MKNIVAAFLMLSLATSLDAAQIVGPNQPTPVANANEIRVKVGIPPLVPLKLVDDEGKPIEGKIIKWIGPIGEGKIAQQCQSGLLASSAVVGRHEFTAVIVPPTVEKPEDIEVLTFALIVDSGVIIVPPVDNPPPPVDTPPPPVTTDLSAAAKQWLATVKASSQSVKSDIVKAIDEIVKANPPIGITEMDLFLGISLPWAIGTDKMADWAVFNTNVNTALTKLKSQGVTADQYRAALASIANGLR